MYGQIICRPHLEIGQHLHSGMEAHDRIPRSVLVENHVLTDVDVSKSLRDETQDLSEASTNSREMMP